MTEVMLNRLVDKLESGSRERGGSIATGIISIGGTQISDNGGFRWNKKEFVSESFYSKMKSGKVEKGDILIVKDGATTGKVSFVNADFPYYDAAINEHVFRLQINKELANPKYVFYFLFSSSGQREILNDFRGATVGGISRNFVNKVTIPLPDIEIQDRIVTILDKAHSLVEKREKVILFLDELLRARFLEMFGDPVRNTKKWSTAPLKEFGEVITGNTPPRSNKNYYNENFIEWIKTNNIILDSLNLERADEYLSEAGYKVCRYVSKNSLLVACIAGSLSSIGRAAIADRRVAFNQQINAIVPNDTVSVYFLYWMFKLSQDYIQSYATSGMKKLITKGEFEKIVFIKPDYAVQAEFEIIASKHHHFFEVLQKSKNQIDLLQKSLSKMAFSGELTFNTAVDLELLLENDYEFFKKNHNRKSIQLLLDRLEKSELNESKFYESSVYNKAKGFAFELLSEGEIRQEYDLNSNRIKLTL